MTIIAGRISESAVASYQILLNLLAVVFMVALGLAAATAVLTSEAIGRNAPRDAERASWTGLGLNTLCMLAVAVAVFVFARPIARAYTADAELVLLIAAFMPLVAAILAPDGGQVVAAAALRARGDNWFPTASHIVAYALVMPPLGFVLAELNGMGVAGLMHAILWASVLSMGVLCVRLWWLGRRSSRQ
jgi:MATE family multidrug resistance protein